MLSTRHWLTYLIRELSNALHKVLIGFPVPGYNLAHHRDHIEGVGIVQAETQGKFQYNIQSNEHLCKIKDFISKKLLTQ